MARRMSGLRPGLRWGYVGDGRGFAYRGGSGWKRVRRGWSPVADVAIALSKAKVSRCTDVVVVGDNEFDVLTKVCPGLVCMVGLSISLCEDGVGCVD